MKKCISLTEEENTIIKRRAKDAGYPSISAYMVAMSLGRTDEPEAPQERPGRRWVRYSPNVTDMTGPDTEFSMTLGEFVPADRDANPTYWYRGGGVYIIVRSGGVKRAKLVERVSPAGHVLLLNQQITYARLHDTKAVLREFPRRNHEAAALEDAFLAKYGYPWTDAEPMYDQPFCRDILDILDIYKDT